MLAKLESIRQAKQPSALQYSPSQLHPPHFFIQKKIQFFSPFEVLFIRGSDHNILLLVINLHREHRLIIRQIPHPELKFSQSVLPDKIRLKIVKISARFHSSHSGRTMRSTRSPLPFSGPLRPPIQSFRQWPSSSSTS